MKKYYTGAFLHVMLLLFFVRAGFAQTITLTAPFGSATYVNTVNVSYSISEVPKSVELVWTYTSGYYTSSINQTWTFTMNTPLSKTKSFTFQPPLDTASTNPFTVSPNTPMPDGTYSVYAEYQRTTTGNPTVKSVTKTNIVLSNITLPPAILSPTSDTTVSNLLAINDTIPETALAGSIKMIFSGLVSDTLTLNNFTRNESFTLNTDSVTSNSYVTAATFDSIPPGVYSLSLSYSDTHSHSAAVTTINNLTIRSGTLALSLDEFYGSINTSRAALYWETASETNTAFFEVQHSLDGLEYSAVGRVQAAGNAVSATQYQFSQPDPPSGNNYYRLRMVNENGSYTFSNVLMLNNAITAERLHIFPNPSTGQLHVNISSLQGGSGLIIISDLGGRSVLHMPVSISPGSNAYTLNVADLPAGLYFLQEGSYTIPFIRK
jgi:hypothetical protein